MLEIKPSTDRLMIARYCKKCGIVPGEAFYLYTAADSGELLAAALFEVLSDRVSILHYETQEGQDPFLMDGILRAGLQYASRFGIENGCIPENLRYEHRALFAKLNYPAPPVFNITNFFAKYKNCKSDL